MSSLLLRWPSKYTGENIDYVIDWSQRLNGDVISARSFTVVTPDSSSIAIGTSAFDNSRSSVFLSGGNPGSTATILCQVTTSGGRTLQEKVQISIL